MSEESVNIVCPHCSTVNRAPRARLHGGGRPVCGQCQSELFDGHPVEIGSVETLDKHIARNDMPVVVDFWADWCGPCKMMAPQFASAAARMEPSARFAKLDTQAHQDIAARYHIRGIPTMILFSGGREIARQSGAMDASSIARWIASHTGADA